MRNDQRQFCSNEIEGGERVGERGGGERERAISTSSLQHEKMPGFYDMHPDRLSLRENTFRKSKSNQNGSNRWRNL